VSPDRSCSRLGTVRLAPPIPVTPKTVGRDGEIKADSLADLVGMAAALDLPAGGH